MRREIRPSFLETFLHVSIESDKDVEVVVPRFNIEDQGQLETNVLFIPENGIAKHFTLKKDGEDYFLEYIGSDFLPRQGQVSAVISKVGKLDDH